ncbi:MAG: hypothetical protein ACI9CF_001230 [Candidatus Omnitrophota bacterium]|jgi:hypothetical protein
MSWFVRDRISRQVVTMQKTWPPKSNNKNYADWRTEVMRDLSELKTLDKSIGLSKPR